MTNKDKDPIYDIEENESFLYAEHLPDISGGELSAYVEDLRQRYGLNDIVNIPTKEQVKKIESDNKEFLLKSFSPENTSDTLYALRVYFNMVSYYLITYTPEEKIEWLDSILRWAVHDSPKETIVRKAIDDAQVQIIVNTEGDCLEYSNTTEDIKQKAISEIQNKIDKLNKAIEKLR